jgi:DNA-binding MarR family transcriptional regulator
MTEEMLRAMPLGRFFAYITKSYYGALSKRLENLEIDRYYSVLLAIDKSGSHCTQHTLCLLLDIDKVSMVRMIDYFLKKNFVRKIQNPADRREYFIELTSKAQQKMPEFYAAVNEMNEVVLSGFTPLQREAFLSQLLAIEANINELPSEKVIINYKKSPKK